MYLRHLILLTFLVFVPAASSHANEAQPTDQTSALRDAAFQHLAQALAKAPLRDVLWPGEKREERISLAGANIERRTLRIDSGGIALDLKWDRITARQLASALRRLSAVNQPDGKAAGMAAALFLSDGATAVAETLVAKANEQDPRAQAEYDSWRVKLGLDAKPQLNPLTAAGMSSNSSTLAKTSTSPVDVQPTAREGARHVVPKEHPRLFGTRAHLQELSASRAGAFKQMERVARSQADDIVKMPSLALVYAIRNDKTLGDEAVRLAMNYVNGPIKTGHVTFGVDVALCAMVYDLCHDCWTPEERTRFHEYMNKTVDANVDNENHVFANPYYGYKNWGIGLACYATMYENPRAVEILKRLDEDFRTRAVPALEMAGDGGGWAEGHYIHYFLYEWLVFCEVARTCEGIDYYALAPRFFSRRAIASLFEMYPGASGADLNRPIPMGDGGYGAFGGFSEKILAARRILCDYYRADPAHQAVRSYDARIADNMIDAYAYMSFLWNDPAVPMVPLKDFKLSHYSPGPGFVYARSSWEADATYFFFKCGDRFTAHQHLDVGHFLIFKNAPLTGDGGVYDAFDSNHCVNYYIRTIAHNTMLIFDPTEKWPEGIRAGPKPANDGGQAYPWLGTPIGHNGAVMDPATWEKNRKILDLADILAFQDTGTCVYVAGDCARAYSAQKLEAFTRQIVFLRPGTFVIFDRVKSRNAGFKKTWVLNVHKPPTGIAPDLIVTNGKGRLFIQTLLPERPQVAIRSGTDLYSYQGGSYPPGHPAEPIPESRIEVSPSAPAQVDYFLHVLTATDATVPTAPKATVTSSSSEVTVTIGATKLTFETTKVSAKLGATPLGKQ